MSNDWLLTFAPVFGLLVDLLGQIASAHLFRRTGPSIIAGAALGLVTTLVLVGLTLPARGSTGNEVATAAVALVTYLALAFGYWAFVNLNITSLRIRMLREILRSTDGLSQTELTANYSSDEFLRRRLERLKNSGQLSFVDERWRLESRTLLTLARFIDTIRTMILPAGIQRRDG